MDNNELDKILKEKLKDKIEPTPEFQRKMEEIVNKEKEKRLSGQFEQVNNEEIPKKHNNIAKRWSMALSMVATFILVFTLGMNLKTSQIIGEKGNAKLTSIKAIEPTNLESGVLANTSEFLIKAEGENLNTEIIQKSVYVEPALEYTIEKTLNKDEYKLKFVQNIPDNTIVKLQYIKDEITQDSWAYQTSNKLSITKTYPNNNETNVSDKTVVEVDLSYADVDNLDKNVSISPATEGTWEHLGKVWRFTPKTSFENSTEYTITLGKGIESREQKLANNYVFSFTVGNEVNAEQNVITLDRIITAKPNEQIKIEYQNHTSEKFNLGKVAIGKFATIDDFIQYVQTGKTQNVTKIGDYEVEDNYGIIELKQSLTKGFYIAKIKDDNQKELFDCPIQISEMSAYAMETERDVLTWVAKGNEIAQEISVEYLGKTVKTDKDGIAKFVGIADGSESIKYAKIGNDLVIGIYNFTLDNYPRGYIYTDRPLYKNTDTINIWGFVPRSIFFDKIEEEFYIELNNEGKQKINVEKDGTFKYKIKLEKHLDNENANIELYYKNTSIANRYIAIKNYELQNYNYEVIRNKDYGYTGEEYQFDIKVTHITGLVVPNKNIKISYNGNMYDAKTGEDGIAHVTIKLEKNKYEDENQTGYIYDSVEIFNGDLQEYTDAETSIYIIRFNRNIHTKIDEKEQYKATLYKLDENKNTIADYDIKKLYTGTYETEVTINLIEETSTRKLEDYYYNNYTKENEPRYSWSRSENSTKIKTITSKNGIIEINKNELSMKKNTEEIRYAYSIQLVYKDTKGRVVKDNIYVARDEYEYDRIGYWDNYEYTSANGWNNTFNKIDIEKYYSFRYLLKRDKETFKVGDEIDLALAEASEKGINEIENKGKLLTINFKENIYSTSVLTDSKFNYKFTDKDFPGCKITAAYFVNGKFYRMPAQYFDFEEESKKIDLEISTDKEQYAPKDKVTVTIKATNNGTPVKAAVNISVVNEAVFAIEEDNTNLIETIYENRVYPNYTYSSFIDSVKYTPGGEGGGDGIPRGNFADTAHFETINTDQNGNATCTFTLPENVTTYRITAHAANEELQLGVEQKSITSKIDFFIQSTEPRGVKTLDDLVLNATSISENQYDVDYEFTIKELNKTLTAKAKSNTIATVNFGKLPFGTYTAIIKGSYGLSQDAVEYKFNVKETTQEVKKKTTTKVTSNTSIKPERNPIVLEIYNKQMSKYVKYIDFIENTASERLDTQIAYNKVQDIKNKYYGESNNINRIPISLYEGNRFYLKNLRNGKEDLILTALTLYYAKDYCDSTTTTAKLEKQDNVFEYYLIAAANGETVLNDLIYLKNEKDISNYDKLLLALALEFEGDFQNAKDLYSSISLTQEELKDNKSIVSIIETFIEKDKASEKIDEIIANTPDDEYIRYAILSYFQNNYNEIGRTENVKITVGEKIEDVTVNGMEIKTISLNNNELANIRFETSGEDIMVSYYYQTSLENIESKDIQKDIKIQLDEDLKVGKESTLEISFDNDYEGEVRIALPNSLRLAEKYKYDIETDSNYYIQNNNIDYITLYKTKKCKYIRLKLLVINEGNYKFENIVCNDNGKYHISNSLDIKI